MKIALVTGGTKGLGETISRELSKNNYRVYAISRTPSKMPKGILTKKVDISSKAQVRSILKLIEKEEGSLDVLVNNAGINDQDDIQKTFLVNIFAPYYLMQQSLPLLEKTKGKIINITSINGLIPTPESGIYAASKHALEGLSISLSYEYHNNGVSVTNIAPGVIHNPNSKALSHTALRGKYPIFNTLFPVVTKESVATKVVEITQMADPPRRIVVGRDAKIAYAFSRIFPNIWFWLIQRLYSHKK